MVRFLRLFKKKCVDDYLPYLTVTINYSLKENTFREELKRS